MNDRLQHYISRIETSKNLPILPHILVKLIKICQDENGSIQDMSKIIRSDASLTTKILKLANSSYFRSPEKIAQIDQALVRMGREAVKNLAISSAVHQVFSKSKILSNGFDLKRFWRHSLTSAVLARMIAEKTAYNLPEQAFLAGMIHDVGRLILATNFPGEYKEVLNNCQKSSESLVSRENKMGALHTDIGAWLLRRWNLDSMTIDAVLYHHEPVGRIKESFPLVRIVYAANNLARLSGSADDPSGILKELFPGNFAEAVDILQQAEEEVQDVAKFLGLPIGEREHISANNEQVEINSPELVKEVQDLALLIGVLQNLVSCPDEDAILRAIQEGLAILFDIRKVIFFLVDPEERLLKAKVVTDQGQIDSPPGLILTLQHKESLIVQSIIKNTWFSSIANNNMIKPPIMDEQIMHIFGSQGLICLPLIRSGEVIGVIVIGVEIQQEKSVMQQERLLNLYTSQVATALYVEHLKQKQAKRITSERLAATTALARKVIHEANNPLSIIKNYLRIVSSRLLEGNSVQREVTIIGEEIDRISRILKELSDFSKSRSLAKEPVDINELLSNIIKIVSGSLPATFNIKIHSELDSSIPQVKSDKDALKQIFINLIKNAVEALTGQGNIYIESRFLPEVPHGVLKPNGTSSIRHVRIVVRDDGPGISPEIEARLFEPYCSTKGNGHSGIGLSVVSNLIRDLGGSVTSSSTVGQGAAFTILLPVDSV